MYIYIWEYKVTDENRSAFESAYGKDGDWDKLFSGKEGYIKTELFLDSTRNRYITIDYWESKQHFIDFQKAFRNEYNELNKKCDELTYRETAIGEFDKV